MKIKLLLLLLLSAIALQAQTPNWSWGNNYEGFNSDTRGLTATTATGDVYLIGNFDLPSVTIGTVVLTNGGAPASGDLYIIKYNSYGTLLWAKKEGGLNMDSITAITTDANGDFYLLGVYVSQITFGSTTLNSSYRGSFLTKYNGQGDVIWARNFAVGDENCEPTKIRVDQAENIYMTGYYRTETVTFDSVVLTSSNYDINTNNGNTFLVKMDDNGSVLWAKGSQRTGTSNFPNLPYDMAVDTFGNVFIGGNIFSATMVLDSVTLTGTGSTSPNIFAAKYDANGNLLWAKQPIVTNPNNYCTAVATDASGNAYFSGTFIGTMTFDSVGISTSSSGNKLYTVKYSPEGTALWAKTATSNGYSNIDSSDTDSAGNLYVTGTFSDTSINFGNGILGSNSGTGNFFVVKYTSAGIPLWCRTPTTGSFDINNRLSIDCYSQNEIYIAGYFYNSSLNFGNFTLTKKNTTGVDIFIAKLYYAPLANTNFTEVTTNLYPNPVREELTVEMNQGSFDYQLVDALGKIIATGVLTPEASKINCTSLCKGIYFLALTSEDGRKVVKKIIRE